jgi:hypothetical protein
MKTLLMPVFRYIMLLFIGSLLFSCKSSQAVAGTEKVRKLNTRQIVKNYRPGQQDYSTLSGRVKVDYIESGKRRSTTLSFRMQKDSVIWLSAPLGMVKALITPTEFQFYNRLENTYFEGDFAYLQEIAGVELDFDLLEALLFGESMLNLDEGKFQSEILDGNYALSPRDGYQGFDLKIFLDPVHFRVSRQYVADPISRDSLRIFYRYGGNANGLPEELSAQVDYGSTERQIRLEYKNLEKNRNLRYPYRVPRGFKKIEIQP